MRRPKFPSWVASYIGVPYAPGGRTLNACDCWGLFALVQREVFGFDIADYDGPLFHGRRSAREIEGAAMAFADRFERVPKALEREGDAVLMKMLGVPLHIGVVVCPGFMLHIEEGCQSVLEDYRAPEWRDRIVAFHRAHYVEAA